ncbi:MAG: hypothetical protein ACM3UU_05870 [Ignavibacteriales bacterium]
MPPEDHKKQKKIQCWIPLETWDKIVSSGYTSPTIAVNKAFEKLLEDPRENPHTSPTGPQQIPETSNGIPNGFPKIPDVSQEIPGLKALSEAQNDRIEEYKAQVQNLNAEISRLKNIIMEAPDPFEMVKLQERNEGLNLLLGEKEKRIIELTQYKEDIGAFANYFKSKAPEMIEAPATTETKRPWYKFW